MARMLARMSVRARTTAAATVIAALALTAASALLVVLVRHTLADGLESTAEQRAEALADEIERSGLPRSIAESDDDDPEDVVTQIAEDGGAVVGSSQPLARALPRDDAEAVRLPEADHRYVVATEHASTGGADYVVSVAVSREDVDETTGAMLPLLAAGVPIVSLAIAVSTWVLTGRALRPVERIRREVDRISGSDLSSRVAEPPSRDEVHRLAVTMNRMLGRLEGSATRQRRFVSDASHELRSPLATIRQAAEVSRAHPEAVPADELAATVAAESERMQRLVEQMLLLTRADETGSPRRSQAVDLDDLVLTEAARIRRDGLAVDVDGVDPVRVPGDATLLGRAVTNLLANAARHASTTIRVGLILADGGALVTVDDDGPGIPPEDRERVFERFVRLDEARARDAGGSGLGLAIVAEAARLHGGRAWVEESALDGARFVVQVAAG